MLIIKNSKCHLVELSFGVQLSLGQTQVLIKTKMNKKKASPGYGTGHPWSSFFLSTQTQLVRLSAKDRIIGFQVDYGRRGKVQGVLLTMPFFSIQPKIHIVAKKVPKRYNFSTRMEKSPRSYLGFHPEHRNVQDSTPMRNMF